MNILEIYAAIGVCLFSSMPLIIAFHAGGLKWKYLDKNPEKFMRQNILLSIILGTLPLPLLISVLISYDIINNKQAYGAIFALLSGAGANYIVAFILNHHKSDLIEQVYRKRQEQELL